MIEVRRVQPGRLWVSHGPHCTVAIGSAELAELLGVAESTVWRWVRTERWPRTAELAIRAAVLGRVLHPRWRGWRIADDARLYAPNGDSFNPAELEWRLHLHNHVRLLEHRVADLEAELLLARAVARAKQPQRRPLACRRVGRPRPPLAVGFGD